MSDSVEWLRNLARNYADGVPGMTPQDHRAWDIAEEIERLHGLLRRALSVAETGHWRDKAGLSLEAHPLWDDVRAALERK